MTGFKHNKALWAKKIHFCDIAGFEIFEYNSLRLDSFDKSFHAKILELMTEDYESVINTPAIFNPERRT